MDIKDVRFDTYYRYKELSELLSGFAAAYPELAEMGTTGKSYEGRDVYVMSLTNKKTGAANDKPAMYIDGNMHAGEVTGSMVCLYIINHLLTQYGKDPQVTRLMDTRAFYISPRVNPDGAELYLTTPYTLRSSVKFAPDPAVSELPGLHGEDVDGDGRILLMRTRDDKKGEWKVSKRDDRVMVPRLPDDVGGPFYRIYQEGTIKSYEGEPFTVNPSPWGLDMNRNFPANWRSIPRAGAYPASEPEVKNIVDFILAHPNIGAVEAYHTSGGIIFRSPYAYPHEQMDQEDFNTMIALARRGTDLTGYPDVSSHGQSTATIIDWCYENRGIIGFCTELWDMAGRAGLPKRHDYSATQLPTWQETEEINVRLLEWNDRELSGKGFVRWHAFTHPQLGEVEIGGWEPKFVKQNCPPKLLEQECHKNMLFNFAHAEALPDVNFASTEKTRIADGTFQIKVVVQNEGYLPTNISNKGKDMKAARSVKLKLALPEGVALVGGKSSVDLGHLDGYRQGQGDATWGAPPPARSAAKAEYVVKVDSLPAEIEITVDASRGGKKKTKVVLS
jgi:murein tripeptide amidase MpaA